jgi:hypothetical protein
VLPGVTAPVITWMPPRYSLQDLPPGAQVIFLPLTSRCDEQAAQDAPAAKIWISGFLGAGLVWGWARRRKTHQQTALQ